MNKEELIFCPLGGSGEIGMNMNLYAYGKEEDRAVYEQIDRVSTTKKACCPRTSKQVLYTNVDKLTTK